MFFLWVPSHIGLTHNDTVDHLAKTTCALILPEVRATLSLRCYRNTVYSAAYNSVVQRRNVERASSVSVQHHDNFLTHPYRYRRHGLSVRRHNVVSARLRLGYRPLWQVSQMEDVPHYSSCKLCNLNNANTLHHYCLECPTVMHLLPQGQELIDVCEYLMKDDHLDKVLLVYPHFGGY